MKKYYCLTKNCSNFSTELFNGYCVECEIEYKKKRIRNIYRNNTNHDWK